MDSTAEGSGSNNVTPAAIEMFFRLFGTGTLFFPLYFSFVIFPF